ncbi:MAG: hypothetical protein DRI56_12080 [Chloroflexota bacterium]|nr:MAG: hypothetical protein DRI56_12080 [Chloroflexota bacterium]
MGKKKKNLYQENVFLKEKVRQLTDEIRRLKGEDAPREANVAAEGKLEPAVLPAGEAAFLKKDLLKTGLLTVFLLFLLFLTWCKIG